MFFFDALVCVYVCFMHACMFVHLRLLLPRFVGVPCNFHNCLITAAWEFFMINIIFLVFITNSAADAGIVYICLSDESFLSV